MDKSTSNIPSRVFELAKKMHEVDVRKGELEARLDDIKAERDMIESELKDLMEEADLQKFSIAGLGTFYVRSRVYPKVVGDPELAIKWLDDQVGPDIAPRKIDGKRLKDYMEDAAENDKPLPPTNLIEMTVDTGVSLRKAK